MIGKNRNAKKNTSQGERDGVHNDARKQLSSKGRIEQKYWKLPTKEGVRTEKKGGVLDEGRLLGNV